MHDHRKRGFGSMSAISRRDLLIGSAAGATSLALGAGGFAMPARAAMPKQGGHLKAGLGGASTGDTLDPAATTDFFMISVSWAMRNSLSEIISTGEVVPELAESWEPSADLKKWVFKLRKGVEFHNGKTFTAHDVVGSLQYYMAPESKASGFDMVRPIAQVSADDDYTVVIKLEDANADLPSFFAGAYTPIMMIEDDGTPNFEVGTGGYVLSSFEPGVQFTGTRNPNYWKEGRAHFDGVELIAINDGAARTSAMRTGEIDVMHRAEPQTAALLGREPGVQVIEVTTKRHYAVPMHVGEGFSADDNNVRLALKYAVERQVLVDTVLSGHGVVGNDQPLSPTYQYFDPSIEQHTYDPDKARFHLKKAGYNNLEIELHSSTKVFDGAIDTAVLMREQAQRAGLDIKIVQVPADGYWENTWKKAPYCFCWYGGRATESIQFSRYYIQGSAGNDTGWHSDRFASLLKGALETVDPDIRRQNYGEMQRILHDEGPHLTFAFANTLDACSDKIGVPDDIAGNYEIDGGRFTERWWFA